MTDVLLVERHGAVTRLVLQRPQKKNALDEALGDAITDALQDAATDDEVRAVIFASAGDTFCAGVDVRVFLELGEGKDPPASIVKIGETILGFPKPLIAAVQGKAVGMGVTILPLMDMVYAAESASFVTPFVNLGLVVEYGSSFTLPRLMGRQRANELVLRGKPIDARTAEAWGLVTRCFTDETFEASVMEIAQDVAAAMPGAVATCKRLLKEGEQSLLGLAVEREDEALTHCYGSDENVAAVTAFLSRGKAKA